MLIAGGQGQYGTDGSLSLEDCKYYLRYLEGIGRRFRQRNDLERTLPAESEPPAAVLISAPARERSVGEYRALRRYRDDGGAVILLGSSAAAADNTRNLNRLAARLHTDLRFNEDRVVDEQRNLANDPAVLETTSFDDSFPLFDAADLSQRLGDGGGALGNSGDAPRR